MRISTSMINYYLQSLTVGYFNDRELPPDDVRDYESLVETMKLKAVKHSDIDDLHVALAWLLTNEEVDLETFNGGRYPFDTDEMREIISYVYKTLFSEKEKPADDVLKTVELVDVTLEEWWHER